VIETLSNQVWDEYARKPGYYSGSRNRGLSVAAAEKMDLAGMRRALMRAQGQVPVLRRSKKHAMNPIRNILPGAETENAMTLLSFIDRGKEYFAGNYALFGKSLA